MRAETEQVALEGTVERVTFHSEETGFCVLRVTVKGQRDLVTVVGTLPNVVPGETVQAVGAWVLDPQHGRQFRAGTLRSLPPDSVEGIQRFLGSGLVKGIGPVYAAKLVARFGREIFDVIENRSAALEQVEGIGRIRRQRIKEGWNETRTVRAIMAFLLSHGVSTTRAFRIYRTYGELAIQRVSEDPYCLARDVRGIGFLTADKIAASMGIEKTSDVRARAGVEHALFELTAEGHCASARPDLVARAMSMLDCPEEIVARAVDHGIASRRLVQEASGADPLVFLRALHAAEVELAAGLRRLAGGAHPCPPVDAERAAAWCEERIGLKLAEGQREALSAALREKVVVITGGPGVGKTTLVNAIIRVLAAKRLRVVLCAPTGRAAKRLAEATGRAARTIHRLLAYDPARGRFRHDRMHPLAGDAFIVDESSMVDLPLANQLVRAIPAAAALILVGDVDQLPSVGPGMVLADVIASGRFPVCRLTHVFRQAAQSRIVTNAHHVHDGRMPVGGEAGSDSDFFIVQCEDPVRAAELIVKLVREKIPARFGLNPVRDIQVLTPMRRGALGSQNLNAALQAALNPSGESIERFGCLYRVGDKVMQLQNDYDKDVFNGDTGVIAHIDREEQELTVRIDERDVTYRFMELDELAPSYAITIHKSQGCEFPCVVIPLHTQHYVMLQRNLLYTAITRARRLAVLVGTTKAIALAVRRGDAQRRITALAGRIRDGVDHLPEETAADEYGNAAALDDLPA